MALKAFERTQDVECSLVLVADYVKVVEANVDIIFRIVVLAHQRRPQVAVRKLLHLAVRVIQFKSESCWAHKCLLAR
jgi:hypothetical protein